MSIALKIIVEAVKALVDTVPNIENVYARRVVYPNSEKFVELFRTTNKDKFLGFEMYRAMRQSQILSFKNVYRHVHTITTRGYISIYENKTNSSYDVLSGFLQNIQDVFNVNLTLSGIMENSEPSSLEEITIDVATGRVLWAGNVSWILYEREIVNNIS
jgi:hypothetical protein